MYRRKKRIKRGHGAIVDIKTLKDVSVLNQILNSSVDSRVSVDLSKLKDSPKAFAVVVEANIDRWVKSCILNDVLKTYSDNIKTPELSKIINDGIIKFASNIEARKPGRYTRYKLGKEIPRAIDGCMGFMNANTKSKVLSEILGKQDNFYPYSKKMLAQISTELASSDEELVGVLSSFYKVIEKKAFFEIVNRVTGGIKNVGVQKVLDKTKKFHVCRYTKAEVKNDAKIRAELLKDIARTPSSAKNLNFMISFDVNDLKQLASVMRFNFLEWYFKDRFECTAKNYNRPDRYKSDLEKHIKNTGLDKIHLEAMKEDELTEILFGVGLKKNDEVVNFVERYKYCKKIESGISLQKEDLTIAFKGYYYW